MLDIKKFLTGFGPKTPTQVSLETSVNDLLTQIDALNQIAIVSETDVAGNITYVNDAFCEISGYTSEDLIFKNHRVLKSGHQLDKIFVDLWQTISSGNVWKGVVKNKAKNGTYYWVSSAPFPVLGTDNKPKQYISIRFDITKQIELEDSIEHTKEELCSTIQTLKVAMRTLADKEIELKGQVDALNNAAIVSETDLQGNITFVNDTFCEISGYTASELIGKNHRILKSGDQPDSIFTELWQTISSEIGRASCRERV